MSPCAVGTSSPGARPTRAQMSTPIRDESWTKFTIAQARPNLGARVCSRRSGRGRGALGAHSAKPLVVGRAHLGARLGAVCRVPMGRAAPT